MAWRAQKDLGVRYRPSYPLEKFLFEALPGVGKVVQTKSRLQKTINTSEPQNQFTENNTTAIKTPGA